MLGGKNRQPLGYTIIEVMIVLAVSGLMFVIAASFINGKHEKTSFTEGVNEMASRFQSTIEQVIDGNYSDIPISCTFDPASGTNPNGVPSGNLTQGQNPQCVFLGKFVYFITNSSNYRVYSLAGGRFNTTTNLPITTIADAKPESITNLTVNDVIPQSLTLWGFSTTTADGITTPYPNTVANVGLAFFQNQGKTDSNHNYVSGAGSVALYRSTLSSNALSSTQLLNAATICLTDGVQYALIQLGGESNSASSLNVSVHWNGSRQCYS